jgi:hypothetical protein
VIQANVRLPPAPQKPIDRASNDVKHFCSLEYGTLWMPLDTSNRIIPRFHRRSLRQLSELNIYTMIAP